MNPQVRRKKTGGRRAGTPNRYTGAFREAVQIVYGEMGGHEAFTRWAKQNKTEFYRIASRLIPVEVHNHDTQIQVLVQRETSQATQIPMDPANALPDYSPTGDGRHG